MSRATREELQALRRSKQAMRTEQVLTLARNFGYETRRSGGGSSHIVVWNPKYPELPSCNVIAGTKKLASERNIIDQCLQILDWEEQQLNQEDPVLEPISAFFDAAQTAINLPDDIELVQGRKNPGKFLRHRKFTQIATQINGNENQDTIIERCDYLRGRAKRLETVLDKAVEDYDFELDIYPNGTLILWNETHHVSAVLYAFTPRLENFSSIKHVEDVIAAVELHQEDCDDALDAIMDFFNLREQETRRPERRDFVLKDPSYGENKGIVSLNVSNSGQFSQVDVIRFIQQCENLRWRDLHKDIKTRFGFHMHKLENGMIQGKHTLFDITFEVDPSDFMSEISDSLTDFADLSEDEQDETSNAALNLLEKIVERYTTISEAIIDYEQQRNGIMNEAAQVFKNIVVTRKGRKPKLGEIGEIGIHANGKEYTMPALFTHSNKRVLMTTFTPESIRVLKQVKHDIENLSLFGKPHTQHPNIPLPPFAKPAGP